VEVTPRGTILVPEEPGFGYEVDRELIEQLTARKEFFP
jgi:L-alanine-DL-glutamate epimerase-like enolase superfamily enzyme